MRALLYTPCYTIDRDGQSLRITSLATALSVVGWQFDIVTTPVFFLGDRALRTKLQRTRQGSRSMRVFLTHPGLIATLRYRLHRTEEVGGRVAALAVRNGVRDVRQDGFSMRLARRIHGRYSRIFSRIGDADWIAPAVLQGLRLARSRSYQLVFASASSYFASHIAAAVVSTARRLPLVLDYGDPWGPEPPGRPNWLDGISEALVLRRAGKVIVTNDRAQDLLFAHHPFLVPSRVAVISQGYNGWFGHEPVPPRDEGRFTIAYTGNLWPGLRSSMEFFEGVRIANRRGVPVNFVRAGPNLPTEEAEWIRREDPRSFFEDLGLLSHEEALALQRKATMLLVIGNRSRCQIPGKVIEYIGARRPILCLSQGPDDLAATFVKEHGLGVVVPNNAGSIVNALSELHRLWSTGKLETVYRPKDVENFSWVRLAGHLDGIFREAMAEHLREPALPAWCADGRRPDRTSDGHVMGQRLEQ